MGRLERCNRGNAGKGGSRHGEQISELCARIVKQKTVHNAGKAFSGEGILRSVRPELEQGAVWDLAVAGIENALDVTYGKKGFPQAVTCIGNCAVSCGASGATVNSAMEFAAETLTLAGYNEAASLMPLISQGIIAFLLIKTIIPGITSQVTEEVRRNRASSQDFIPAEVF